MIGLRREHAPEPLRVEGEVPPELRGTLYRNGPALFGLGSEPYAHAFDGDGAVTAVRFGDGGVTGACRVVATPHLVAEREAGRRLFRNYAQTGVGWRRWLLPPKNTANISVLPWGRLVLALFEAGLPIALDGATLQTVGPTDLGVVPHALCAHPHAVRGTTWAFGLRAGPRFALDLFELRYPTTRRVGRVPLPWPTLVHDMAVTDRHLIFFVHPRRLRLARLLAGIGDFRSNLTWRPELGTCVLIVPKDEPTRVTRIDVPAFFSWHTAHAWEDAGGLWIDHIAFDDDATDAWFGRMPWDDVGPPPRSRLVRARVDVARRTWDAEVIWDQSIEFPAVEADDNGPPSHVWALRWTTSATPVLSRWTAATGASVDVPLGKGAHPSEPVLAGRHVLSLVNAGSASFVAVIDADAPEHGPVARAWFDHPIPFTFHGAFAPSPTGEPIVAKPSSLRASGLAPARAVVSPSLATASPDPSEHQPEAVAPPSRDR